MNVIEGNRVSVEHFCSSSERQNYFSWKNLRSISWYQIQLSQSTEIFVFGLFSWHHKVLSCARVLCLLNSLSVKSNSWSVVYMIYLKFARNWSTHSRFTTFHVILLRNKALQNPVVFYKIKTFILFIYTVTILYAYKYMQ